MTGNPGGLGDDLTSSRTATGSIAGIFGGGSDGVLRYQLATDTSGLPSTLTSKGGNVVYNVNTATQTLTGYVENIADVRGVSQAGSGVRGPVQFLVRPRTIGLTLDYRL